MKTPLLLSLILPISAVMGCEPAEANTDNADASVDAEVAELQSQVDQLQDMVEVLQAQSVANADAIGSIDTTNFVSMEALKDYVSADELESSGYLTDADMSDVVQTQDLLDALEGYADVGVVEGLQLAVADHSVSVSTLGADLGTLQSRVGDQGVAIAQVNNAVQIINAAGYLTSTDVADHATQTWVTGQAYTTETEVSALGFATETWVAEQGYALDSDMSAGGYVTSAWVGEQGYALWSDVTSLGFATEDWVSQQGFASEAFLTSQGYATEAWVVGQGFAGASDLSFMGFATENWVIDQGYAEGLADYLFIDSDEDAVYFEGANVFIQSGSGFTDDDGEMTGVGNLIVGYDEDMGDADKTGSHNLVVGSGHSYLGYGGFVAGQNNIISGAYAAIDGGFDLTDSGLSDSNGGGDGDIDDGDIDDGDIDDGDIDDGDIDDGDDGDDGEVNP
jgi:hypothetical protein